MRLMIICCKNIKKYLTISNTKERTFTLIKWGGEVSKVLKMPKVLKVRGLDAVSQSFNNASFNAFFNQIPFADYQWIFTL